MKSYLLDTNIVSFWFDDSKQQHEPVRQHVKRLPSGVLLAVSAITWGEIEYGHRLNDGVSDYSREKEEEFRSFIEERAYVVDVKKSTRKTYGALRAKLFNKCTPADQRKKRRPEELLDPTTALNLGVQENDLWIAAQALEHNFVLVSNDKMTHIQEAAGEDLQVEDWAS
jgi:tRNA(fMet)-specific endonuclease VapC